MIVPHSLNLDLHSYVPVHLEYVLTELLKNSFRATVENHVRQRGSPSALPAVHITLVPPSASSPSSNPGANNPKFFSIRIRDQGGGVSSSNLTRVFSYAFTTAGRGAEGNDLEDDGGGPYAAQHIGGNAAIGAGDANLFGEITGKGVQTGIGTMAGLGYGLPMSRLYTKFVSLSCPRRQC